MTVVGLIGCGGIAQDVLGVGQIGPLEEGQQLEPGTVADHATNDDGQRLEVGIRGERESDQP